MSSQIKAKDKVLCNDDLIGHICDFLRYNEQLAFSQVNSTLNFLIRNEKWRSQHRGVQISVYNENEFIVSSINDATMVYPNDTCNVYDLFDEHSVHFNATQLELFLNMNQENIQKLKIKPENQHFAMFPLTQNFVNLTYLELERVKMTYEQLRYFADNYRNLETLYLIESFDTIGLNILLVEDEMGFEILKSKKNLKNLKIIEYKLFKLYSFRQALYIVNVLNLQSLSLNLVIDLETVSNQYNLQSRKPECYQQLQIGMMWIGNDSIYFRRRILPSFVNLKKLWLNGERITKSYFNIFKNSCESLVHLTLEHCRISHFAPLHKLNELNIRSCTELTFIHLQTFLSNMNNLIRFTSIKTNFTGDFVPFSIKSSLQSFKMKVYTRHIIELLNHNFCREFCALKELYLNTPVGASGMNLHLKNAKNLQYIYYNQEKLHIENEDFLQLKDLEKVVFTHYKANESFQLERLLEHENIREISILSYTSTSDPQHRLKDPKNVTKNLRYFNIPHKMMETEMDFVFNLLNTNPNLSLKCTANSVDFIRSVLTHNNFPTRFGFIYACGFLMDCASIIENRVKALLLFEPNCYFMLRN